jgi:hypothetical protein
MVQIRAEVWEFDLILCRFLVDLSRYRMSDFQYFLLLTSFFQSKDTFKYLNKTLIMLALCDGFLVASCCCNMQH